jgi:hypothetical protein
VSGKTVRRIAPALLATTLVSGTMMGLSATAASAQTASAGASKATNVSPDTSYVTLHFHDGNGHSYACTEGKIWYVDATVTADINGCNVQAIMFFPDGRTYCLNPNSNGAPPDFGVDVNLLITSTKGDC